MTATIRAQERTELSETAWRLLPFAAVAAAFAIVGLAAVGIAGVGFRPDDNAMGDRYVELLQAVRSPILHRVEMFFDAAGWLTVGTVFVLLAAVTYPRAAGRASLIAVCGVGQLVGAQGGFERWIGISDVAAAYATAGADKALIAQTYVTLFESVLSHFHEGQLLQGAGFLLAAWGLLEVPTIPRWLAIAVGLPGVTSTLLWLGNSFLTEGVPFFPFVMVHVLVFVLGANIVLAAWLFRRRRHMVATP